MPNPNPNAQPPKGDGKDGAQPDPWEKLRGQNDANGVPTHPEEKAEFYKKKSDSSNVEAQRIIEDNKSLQVENEKLKNPNPNNQGNANSTVKDLSAKIPDWNLLTPQQQTAILNSYSALHNDITTIKGEVAKIVDKQDFDKGYNALVLDEQFTVLSEFKEEFIAKSYEKENLKTPLRTLAIAFLAEKGKWGKVKDPNPNPNPDAGRSGLDDGTAGDTPPAGDNNTYTSQEAQELRKSDPKKYMRLVSTKKLVIKD